jgi:hypothetical protein
MEDNELNKKKFEEELIIKEDKEETPRKKIKVNSDNDDITSSSSITIEKSWHDNIDSLIVNNKLFGWPEKLKNIPEIDHGWFRPGNIELLDLLIEKDMKCVIELGSWLGKSTKFLLERAPKAVIFAVDIWLNEYFENDCHYDSNAAIFANIINGCSIYDQFLVNTSKFRSKKVLNASGCEEFVGLIPCKLDSCEALQILKDQGVKPDLIYIDANHHFDPVVKDVTTCLNLFPDAIITGSLYLIINKNNYNIVYLFEITFIIIYFIYYHI